VYTISVGEVRRHTAYTYTHHAHVSS